MTAYVVLIFLILIAFIYNAVKGKEKGSKKTIIVITIFIIFMQGLRHFDVGIDLITYRYHFNRVSNLSFLNMLSYRNNEHLYFLSNWIISNLTNNFRVVLFFAATATYVPLAIISYKYSKSPILSIFLFITLGLFIFSLSGLRQTIAIGLTLMSFKYIKNKTPIKFIITIILASLFHLSALVFLISYPAYHFKATKKYIPIVIGLIGLIFIFKKPIFDNLYALYDGSYIPYDTNAYSFLIGLIIIWLFSMFWFNKTKDSHITGLLNLILVAIIIQIFASYSPVAMRLGYYFIVYLVLLIPEIVERIQDRSLKFVSYTLIIIFFSTYFLSTLEGNIMQIYPYKFYWEYTKVFGGLLN